MVKIFAERDKHRAGEVLAKKTKHEAKANRWCGLRFFALVSAGLSLDDKGII